MPTSCHDAVPDAARFLSASRPFFGSNRRVRWSSGTRVPRRRLEYFTPGTWQLHVSPYARPASPTSEIRDLHAGLNPPIGWDKAVYGPSLRGTTRDRAGERPRAWRIGGAIDVILPMFGDSAGRPQTPQGRTDTGSISLYRGGIFVGVRAGPAAARFEVPAEPADYRLTSEVIRNAPLWPLAGRIDAEWTFRSSTAGDGRTLPLFTLRFDPVLDLRNRARGGLFSFPAYAERQGDGQVDAILSVDVSFDDGATWRPAAVTGSGDRWAIGLRHPDTSYVSLRATVSDASGDSLRQTVIRAYALGR